MRTAPLSLDDLAPWADLLSAAFDRPTPDMVRVLARQHATFPVVAWGTWDGDVLIAQYSCLMRALRVPGRDATLPVGMSVNLAVHPAYRGQGLVRPLADRVYDEVRARGAVAGVGFSNAAGVQVDRRSRGYGYRVVGRLRPAVALLLGPVRSPFAPHVLTLTDAWPAQPPVPRDAGLIRFADAVDVVAYREGGDRDGGDETVGDRSYVGVAGDAEPPARRYAFGVWRERGVTRGAVAFRWERWGRVRGATLLAAEGDDLPALIARWSASLRRRPVLIVRVLATPASPIWWALRRVAWTVTLPVSRTPYYLTVKPLGDDTPAELFDYARWDCMGGDVL
ncbi:MAG: GNAT family N-acetyltransferase [Ardenticatenales bacterium]|nr:GNAT family N-acetyltransferase [Ardenticatenales bacterium]